VPISHSISDDNDPAGSLEEFGLSKYEARAYMTMIGKGSLAASEIAYYANLPRTKIYQTMKKLEKKGLAVVSKQKPLICSAIPPEEAFGELVNLHDRRVKNMKKIVENLQKINDEGQRPKGSEERRYFILDPNSALEKVASLLASSRSSVNAALEPWGLRLLSQCRQSLLRGLTNGSRVRIILSASCLGSESLVSIPEGIELRFGGVESSPSNLLIVDSTHMVSVDSSNGKAALFSSSDSFGSFHSRNFERDWGNATEIKYPLGSKPAIASKAVELVRIVENGLSAKILEFAVSGRNVDIPSGLVETMEEKYGFRITGMGQSEVMDLVDSALRICCFGSLKLDQSNNTISLQSKIESKHVLPLAFMLASYFRRAGNDARIIQQNGKGAQLVQLRLSRPIAS
jgi:sugar-specific transcriptional regulator TrmB